MSVHGCWIAMAIAALCCWGRMAPIALKHLESKSGSDALAVLLIAASTALWQASTLCLIVWLVHDFLCP